MYRGLAHGYCLKHVGCSYFYLTTTKKLVLIKCLLCLRPCARYKDTPDLHWIPLIGSGGREHQPHLTQEEMEAQTPAEELRGKIQTQSRVATESLPSTTPLPCPHQRVTPASVYQVLPRGHLGVMPACPGGRQCHYPEACPAPRLEL